MKRALALLLALSASSCLFVDPEPSLDSLRIGEVKEPVLVERTTRHPRTKELLRSWSEWVMPDGSTRKHGTETEWYPTGQLKWEREFDDGESVGHWRGFHVNGAPMSESFHATDEPTITTFWFDDGTLQARGEAWNGVRRGVWRHWYEDGTLREVGEYRENRREGVWSYYHPDGSLQAHGEFDRGERVGVWEVFKVGERPPEASTEE